MKVLRSHVKAQKGKLHHSTKNLSYMYRVCLSPIVTLEAVTLLLVLISTRLSNKHSEEINSIIIYFNWKKVAQCDFSFKYSLIKYKRATHNIAHSCFNHESTRLYGKENSYRSSIKLKTYYKFYIHLISMKFFIGV